MAKTLKHRIQSRPLGKDGIRALVVEIHENWIEATRYLTWIYCKSTRRSCCGLSRSLRAMLSAP